MKFSALEARWFKLLWCTCYLNAARKFILHGSLCVQSLTWIERRRVWYMACPRSEILEAPNIPNTPKMLNLISFLIPWTLSENLLSTELQCQLRFMLADGVATLPECRHSTDVCVTSQEWLFLYGKSWCSPSFIWDSWSSLRLKYVWKSRCDIRNIRFATVVTALYVYETLQASNIRSDF